MDFGVTGKSGAYYPAEQYRRTAAAGMVEAEQEAYERHYRSGITNDEG